MNYDIYQILEDQTRQDMRMRMSILLEHRQRIQVNNLKIRELVRKDVGVLNNYSKRKPHPKYKSLKSILFIHILPSIYRMILLYFHNVMTEKHQV